MLHLFFDGDIRREGKSMEKNSGVKLIAQNKKAYHDYFVLEKLEAGIELFGTEVKSRSVATPSWVSVSVWILPTSSGTAY